MVTHIYFDWSSTLARPKTTIVLISECSPREKRATLFADSIPILKELVRAGYTIGIISNSKKSPQKMIQAFREIGIAPLLRGSIIFTNSRTMCKKPCKYAFRKAIAMDNIKPQNAVMVGNNYRKDVLGARNAGLHAVHIDRIGAGPVTKNRIRGMRELPGLLAKLSPRVTRRRIRNGQKTRKVRLL
jgi:putative hydrolase of the HAD superfamily